MVDVEDLDAPDSGTLSATRHRRGWRVTGTAAVGALLVLLLVSRSRQQQAQARKAEDELHVAISSAQPVAGAAAPIAGELSARVRLRLSSSVPVTILDGELDDAPPVSSPSISDGHQLTRTPELTVSWQVRCAEVGSLPGPRLLELDLRGHYAMHRVELVLPSQDTAPTIRAFRLAAATACGAGESGNAYNQSGYRRFRQSMS